MERRNLDVDGHLGIINSRIDRHRWDVASLEQRLDNLEAANTLLSAKVAALESRLCQCGREEQPIIVIALVFQTFISLYFNSFSYHFIPLLFQ